MRRTLDGHWVRSSRARRTALIYVPSMLGPNRIWSQAPLFQHALFTVTRALHREGCCYYVLKSLRGTRRERSLLVQIIGKRVLNAIGTLREAGYHRIGLLGGSIAGYALLQNIELVNRLSALMLLSPVHHLSPSIAQRFGYNASDENGDIKAELLSRSSALSTPIAIVHGVRDELSPSLHSSIFMAGIPSAVPRCYLPVADEGHIFESLQNWQRVVDCFMAFTREHLVSADSRSA